MSDDAVEWLRERLQQRDTRPQSGGDDGIPAEVYQKASDDIVTWAEELTTIDGDPVDYSRRWRFWTEPLRAATDPDTPKDHLWNFGRGLGKTEQSARAKWYMASTTRLLDAIYSTPRMRQIRTFQKTIVRRMVNNSRGDPPLLKHLLDNHAVQVQRNDLKGGAAGPGSVLEARSAWNDGEQLQGYRGQFGIADEFHQWTQPAVENLKNAVDKGLERHLFVGTPNFEGTLYHQYWTESDQREWFHECPECDHTQTVTLSSVELTDTDPKSWDRLCSRCGEIQPKDHILLNGYWKPTNDDGVHRGYQFSQLLSPRHDLDAIMREYNRPTTPEGDFARYRLARFYSGAAKPIPEQSIQRASDPDKSLLQLGLDDYNHFLGCDFGGGEGSQTVAVVAHVTERQQGYPSQFNVDTVEFVETDSPQQERRQLADLLYRFDIDSKGRAVLDDGFDRGAVDLFQRGDRNENRIPDHGWGSTVLGHRFGSVNRDQPQYQYLKIGKDNILKAAKAPWCNRVIRLFPNISGYDDTSHDREVPYPVKRDDSVNISIPYHDDPDTRDTIDTWADHLTSVKREYKELEQSGKKREYFTTFAPNQKDDGFMALVYCYTAATIGSTSANSGIMSVGGMVG